MSDNEDNEYKDGDTMDEPDEPEEAGQVEDEPTPRADVAPPQPVVQQVAAAAQPVVKQTCVFIITRGQRVGQPCGKAGKVVTSNGSFCTPHGSSGQAIPPADRTVTAPKQAKPVKQTPVAQLFHNDSSSDDNIYLEPEEYQSFLEREVQQAREKAAKVDSMARFKDKPKAEEKPPKAQLKVAPEEVKAEEKPQPKEKPPKEKPVVKEEVKAEEKPKAEPKVEPRKPRRY